MIQTAKKLAACVLMLGVLLCGIALSAAAASLPVEEQNGVSLPWLKDVPAESIATGSYSANMLLGASQQLSPVVKPSYSTDSVVFLTDDSSVLTVSSSGVVQAVGVGTATVTAAAGNQICAYTIVVSMDSSMIVTEMDLSLSSNTIYVGNSVSASLQVRPSSASNYATVTLTSSNEKIATVNSFGRVTGVAPGKATITATCGSVVATTTVTVLALPTDSSTGTSGTPSSNSGQVITPNTNYIVLKPGATRTITAKATPASASQSFTFKSGNSSIATVSPTGVVTAVGTGSTSITISNGKATAMVTVIVNRSAEASSGSNSSNDSTNTPDDSTPIPLDPVVQTIQDSTEDQVVFAQAEVPIVTGDILNALRTTGKTLCVVGDGYTLNISGKNIKSTTSEIDTAITFTESEEGLEFELDNGRTLPCAVQLELDVSTYSHLYLYNTISNKWQYLNSYKDGVITADTAGRYLLTNHNLRFSNIDWTFFIAGGVVKVVMNYILVGNPDISIHGAPISTLCCYLTICGLNLFFVWKYSPEKPRYTRLFGKPIVASAVMGAAAWAVCGLVARVLNGHSAYGANALATFCGILAGVVVYGVLVIALRILQAEDVKALPKGEKIAKLLRLK